MTTSSMQRDGTPEVVAEQVDSAFDFETAPGLSDERRATLVSTFLALGIGGRGCCDGRHKVIAHAKRGGRSVLDQDVENREHGVAQVADSFHGVGRFYIAPAAWSAAEMGFDSIPAFFSDVLNEAQCHDSDTGPRDCSSLVAG